ncbi:MAG: reverse transcriptase domain-containing protein [Candidatus Thiodiazotropha sp. L084R]
MKKNLYDKVRTQRALEKAWRVVRANGIISKSETTRREVNEFDVQSHKHINRIYRQLLENRFEFQPSEGILHQKPGKASKRPIVKSPIENRIVQRSTLDTLQSHPPLEKYFKTETSFGGIKNRSVSDAIRRTYETIQSGAEYYIRSDIQSFFTKIPKPTVISIIQSVTNDSTFIDLLVKAVNVELLNMEQLGTDIDNFPIYELGVAQGSCLSPLLGNILLYEFDKKMNKGDITCFRYIDDFIILAPNKKAINASFKRATRLLNEHGLTAYSPKEDSDKAEVGKSKSGFSFLGCDIRPGIIRPNKKSQKRLLTNIDTVFTKSTSLMSNPELLAKKHITVTETLNNVSNIMKGWGNQYSYCNDINLLNNIDKIVDEKISTYLTSYSRYRNNFKQSGKLLSRRRLLGVHLLSDSKRKPIISN